MTKCTDVMKWIPGYKKQSHDKAGYLWWSCRYGILTTPTYKTYLLFVWYRNHLRKLTQLWRQMWQCKYMDRDFAMLSKDTSNSSMKNRHKIAQFTSANSNIISSQNCSSYNQLSGLFSLYFFFDSFDFSTLFYTFSRLLQYWETQRRAINLLSSLWAIK